MNTQIQSTNRRPLGLRGALALCGVLALGTSATNAYAQSPTTSRRSSANLPAGVQPVMIRAASFLQASQARQRTASTGARESYQAAAAAFRELLSVGQIGAVASNVSYNASQAPIITSGQAADDVRTIRAAARKASPSQAAILNRAAGLYAMGAKEYFTAQLRDALLDTGTLPNVSGDRSNGVTITRSGPNRTPAQRGQPSPPQQTPLTLGDVTTVPTSNPPLPITDPVVGGPVIVQEPVVVPGGPVVVPPVVNPVPPTVPVPPAVPVVIP